MTSAVVLLSGGLDSATVLALARNAGYTCYCLSIDYGQRHRAELDAAARVAQALGAREHRVVSVDLAAFGGSALTDLNIAVPTGGATTGIPITYVPARNTVMLSFALAWAEVLGARHIFFGANAVDYSGYPDCRPEYLAAFSAMANLATRRGVEGRGRLAIHTPLIAMTKGEIIRTGLDLGVDYALTWSCYDPGPRGEACGACDSCRLRLKGFAEAGAADPVVYSNRAAGTAPVGAGS